MSEEEEIEIINAYNIVKLHDDGIAREFTKDKNDTLKALLKIIERLTNNDLEKYIDENTCLRCGSGKPGYCEDCFQKLIAENARLQEGRVRYRTYKEYLETKGE